LRAYVKFKLGDVLLRDIGPGDVIGRIWTAALQIADPMVSEAHALVSLREGALKLLGLRGRLSIGGKSLPEVNLSVGLRVGLSPATTLEVVELRVPDALLALDLPEVGFRVLSGVALLVTQPRIDLIAGASPEAAAILWGDGLTWFARLRGGGDQVLVPGSHVVVDGFRIPVVPVAIGASGGITIANPESLERPLHLIVRYDTVHIHREDAPPLTLDGIIARIVSDLATAGVPMGWQLLANDLWRDERDPVILRRNWDAALARLRKKLRDARVRADLVRSDHGGNFELLLARGDRIDDQT